MRDTQPMCTIWNSPHHSFLITVIPSRMTGVNTGKQMFYLLDETKDGLVEMDMLVNEVQAGRISPEHEKIIIAKFSEGGKAYVDFLDFLTYIPLFIEIHGTINENPFDDTRDK